MTAAQKKMRKSRRKRKSKATSFLKPKSKKYKD